MCLCFKEVISSFDDVSNKEAISVLVRNVLAVTKDSEYDSKIIKSKFPRCSTYVFMYALLLFTHRSC